MLALALLLLLLLRTTREDFYELNYLLNSCAFNVWGAEDAILDIRVTDARKDDIPEHHVGVARLALAANVAANRGSVIVIRRPARTGAAACIVLRRNLSVGAWADILAD